MAHGEGQQTQLDVDPRLIFTAPQDERTQAYVTGRIG